MLPIALQTAAPATLFGLPLATAISLAAGAAVLLALMLVMVLALRPRKRVLSPKQYDAELYKRRIMLDELGYEAIHDVRIRDSHNRVLKVDHVLRLPASVLIINSAPPDVAGQVKANPNAGMWRYVAAGGQVRSFPNPIIQMHPLIHAIRGRFPLVRIRILTVFPPSAELGNPPPKGTCLGEGVPKSIAEMAKEDGAPSQAIEAAWAPLSLAMKQASAAPAGSSQRQGTRRAG